MTGIIFKTSWVTNRINLQVKVLVQGRFAGELEQKTRRRQRAGGLIPMDCGEKAYPDWIAAVGPSKREAWQRIFLSSDFKGAKKISLDASTTDQRLQESLNRAATIFRRQLVGKPAMHLILNRSTQYSKIRAEAQVSG